MNHIVAGVYTFPHRLISVYTDGAIDGVQYGTLNIIHQTAKI